MPREVYKFMINIIPLDSKLHQLKSIQVINIRAAILAGIPPNAKIESPSMLLEIGSSIAILAYKYVFMQAHCAKYFHVISLRSKLFG